MDAAIQQRRDHMINTNKATNNETATNNEKAIKAKSVANSYEYGFGVGANVALSGTAMDADDLSIKSDYDRGFKDGYCLGRNVFNSDDLKLLDGVYEYEQ